MLLGEKEYKQALASLKKAYPDVRPALVYDTPFELLVSTMLAAQCTDKQVNKVTAVLYPLYSTPEQFSRLTVEELEPYIHSCGFFHSKAKNIIAMSKILVEKYGGEVPADRDLLTTLPGVGRKTANVVVSNA
ncbi:MAG: endonuclease III, partial [Clostridia bacterium]|nr:endonuclease III [Clostridia bacterium]